MKEIRKEELKEQRVELLPDREEMHFRRARALSAAFAQQGAVAQSNQGVFYNY